MPLNLKNPEVDRLVDEVVALTGESKTEAVRVALAERKVRLQVPPNATSFQRMLDFLEHEVWPMVPKDQLGRRLTREEEDEILGYGPDGV